MELERVYTHRTPMRTLNRMDDDYIEDYRIVRPLGSGGFGKTYLGRKNGKEYAVKVLHDKKNKKHFDREVYMLESISKLCSNYFSCVTEVIYSPERYVIVSDYLDGINSHDLFKQADALDIFDTSQYKTFRREFLSFRLLQDVGSALEELHQNKIVHMDVKADNIIYVTKEQKFKLIDFGIAINLRENYIDFFKKGVRGTPGYVADYLFTTDPNDPDYESYLIFNDSFALGVTVFVLNEKKFPYQLVVTESPIYNKTLPVGFKNITSEILMETIIRITNDVTIGERLPYLNFEKIDRGMTKKIVEEEINPYADNRFIPEEIEFNFDHLYSICSNDGDWCLVKTREIAERVSKEWNNGDYEKSCTSPDIEDWKDYLKGPFTYRPIRLEANLNTIKRYTPLRVEVEYPEGGKDSVINRIKVDNKVDRYTCYIDTICIEGIENGFYDG